MSLYLNISSYYDSIVLIIIGIIIGYILKSFSLKDIKFKSSHTNTPKIVKLSSFESNQSNSNKNSNHKQQQYPINKSPNNSFNHNDHHVINNNHRAPVSAPSSSSSKLNTNNIPQHIAVIMDGNRRYGKKVYGDALKVSGLID